MGVHAPLHISRPRPFKKEGYKVSGVSTAGPVATKVTWHSSGRVEIRSQLYRAVGGGVVFSREVEHIRCFGI